MAQLGMEPDHMAMHAEAQRDPLLCLVFINVDVRCWDM